MLYIGFFCVDFLFFSSRTLPSNLRTKIPRSTMENFTMITNAIAAGFEKADIEKPLQMRLTGASWTAIGSLAAICLGIIGIVFWAVDTVRTKNQKPTLSDLTAAADYQQRVAASTSSSDEIRQAAESREMQLAVLINREVDQLLEREREGGRFGRWAGRVGRGWRGWRHRPRGRFKPLKKLRNLLAWSKRKMEQNVLP